MQLGSILDGASQPVICKPIKFTVLCQKDGKQYQAQAEAVLAFVDEAARAESKALAVQNMKPGCDLVEEELCWLLMAALRNKDDTAQQLCPNVEYGRFRSSIIAEQVGWMYKQYKAFVKDEFPELATPEQQDDLLEQAVGK